MIWQWENKWLRRRNANNTTNQPAKENENRLGAILRGARSDKF